MSEQRAKKGLIRHRFIKTFAVAVGVMAFVSTGLPTLLRAAPQEVLIGHIHPLSGFLAFDGKELEDGLNLAVQEINAAGGIKSLGGAKLKVLAADSEGKPDVAIREVERLYKAGAVAITGCYQSSVTLVATQIAEKFEVPFVISVAVADEVTTRGFRYTFRVQPNAEQMSQQTMENLAAIIKAAGSSARTIASARQHRFGGIRLFLENLGDCFWSPDYGSWPPRCGLNFSGTWRGGRGREEAGGGAGGGGGGSAFVGGLIIGVADSVGAMFLPGSMKTIISFSIFILILLFRPNGLFGGRR